MDIKNFIYDITEDGGLDMDVKRFVYNQVENGALSKGASIKSAKDAACVAVAQYETGLYDKSVSRLIENHIKAALKWKD